MHGQVDTPVEAVAEPHRAAEAAAYEILSVVAALTSLGIWVLLVVDDGRSVGAATLAMVVKFTNLTVILVAVVSAWIALAGSAGPARSLAHLTVMVMAVVTAVVNVVVLGAGLPGGWWGVVDLFQHYLIPVAVLAAWAALGPPVDVPVRRLAWITVVPGSWVAFVLARGALTEDNPYDFLDVHQNGWVPVIVAIALILVLMLLMGAGFSTIDRRRARTSTRH